MPIILSDEEYIQAYKILSNHTHNNDNIIESIKRDALPKLANKNTFLDIGAGTGQITKSISHNFKSCTAIEPSRELCELLSQHDFKVIPSTFEDTLLNHHYDFVLCSHVLYNIDTQKWPAFLSKMIACIEKGGMGMLVMTAPEGKHHDMCMRINGNYKNSLPIIEYLMEHQIPFNVIQNKNTHPTKNFEEMYTLCRFALLEDCFTPEMYADLTDAQRENLDEVIKDYASQTLQKDNTYVLEATVDYIYIQPQGLTTQIISKTDESDMNH